MMASQGDHVVRHPRTATSVGAATVQAREEQHGMCSAVLLSGVQSLGVRQG
jgi:hypothetical protein